MSSSVPSKQKTGFVTDDSSRAFLATLGKWTGGMSPEAFGGAWVNVLSRLALAPGRQVELARSLVQKSLALAQFAGDSIRANEPVGAASGGFALRAALCRSRLEQVSFQCHRTVFPDRRLNSRERPYRTCRPRIPRPRAW